MDVSNNANVKGNLTVTKDATFNSLVDVSGLDVSNNANVKGTLTVINDASFHNMVGVSALDVSNNAKIKKLIINEPDASYSLLEIHASATGGNYAGITFHHDDYKSSGSKDFYANKIQSSWPYRPNDDNSNDWGKQRLEFITTVQDSPDPRIDDISVSVMGYFDNGGLTICGDLYMSTGDISSNSATIKTLTVNNKIQATDISVTNIDVSGTINVNKIDIKEHSYFENDISVNGTLDVSGSILLGNTHTKIPTFTLTSESGQQPFIMLQRGNGNWKQSVFSKGNDEDKHNNSFGLSISDIGLEIFKNNDQDNTVMSDRINNREQCLIIDNSTGNVGIGKRFNTFLNQENKIYNTNDILTDTNDKYGIKYISKATHTLTIIDGSFIIDYSTNSLDPKKKYNTVVKNYHLPDGSGGAANICLNANYISNTDVSVDNVLMKNKTNGLIWRPEHNHYNKESAKIVFEIEDGSYQGGLGFYTNNSIDKSGSNAQCKERMYIDRKGDVKIHNSLDVSALDVSNIATIKDLKLTGTKIDISETGNGVGNIDIIGLVYNIEIDSFLGNVYAKDYNMELNNLILKGNTINISEANGNTGIIDISGKKHNINIDSSDGDIDAGDFDMKISDLDVTNDLILTGNTIDISEASDNNGIIDISGKKHNIKIDSSDGDIDAENFKMKIFDLDVTNDLNLNGNTIDISEASGNTGIIDISGKNYNINIDSSYGDISAGDFDIYCNSVDVETLYVDNIELSDTNNLTIAPDCSFNNNVEISGNLVIDGTLTVSGNTLSVDSDKNWYTNTSDDRIKHNEKPIENPLDILNNLQPYRYIKTKEMYTIDHHFQLNEQGEPTDDSGNVIEDYIIEMGIIAQDVAKIDYLKQLVHKPDGEDGIFYLRYNDLFVLNIDATKTLSNKVSNLENKDNDILAKINNIPVEECFIIEFKDNMEMNRDNTNRDDKGRYHSIKINTNINSNSNWTISNRYFYTPIIKKTYNSENINIIKDIFNSDLYGSVNIDGTKLFPLTNSFIDIILEYNVTIEIESRIIDASKYNNTNNNMFDLGFMFQMYSNLENNIYNNCYEKIQIHNVTPPLNEDFYNSDTNSDKKKYFTYTQQINKEFKLSLSPNTGDKLYKFLESAKTTTIQLGYSIFTNGFRNKDITNTYPPSLYLDNYPWDRVEIPPSTKYANKEYDFKNPFYITVKSSSLKIKTKKLF